MSTHVTINDAELQRKIGKLAILSGKGMEDAVRQVASRFVKSAVHNTPPMILRISPGQAKREWTARVTANYTKMPVVNGQRLTPAEMKRILAQKKKQLGREAAGWNAAAEQLKTKLPAWVKRHSGEGSCIIRQSSNGKTTIIITNSVPYGQDILRIRSRFVLQTVKQGLDGTLRALKNKLIRSVK